MTEDEKDAELARWYAEKTDIERVLILAENSDSTDAIVLATEIRRLRKELAAYKGDHLMAHEEVTRVEVTDERGRVYLCYGAKNVVTSVQDNRKTLKVFLNVGEGQ